MSDSDEQRPSARANRVRPNVADGDEITRAKLQGMLQRETAVRAIVRAAELAERQDERSSGESTEVQKPDFLSTEEFARALGRVGVKRARIRRAAYVSGAALLVGIALIVWMCRNEPAGSAALDSERTPPQAPSTEAPSARTAPVAAVPTAVISETFPTATTGAPLGSSPPGSKPSSSAHSTPPATTPPASTPPASTPPASTPTATAAASRTSAGATTGTARSASDHWFD